jgi:hypothetical protein
VIHTLTAINATHVHGYIALRYLPVSSERIVSTRPPPDLWKAAKCPLRGAYLYKRTAGAPRLAVHKGVVLPAATLFFTSFNIESPLGRLEPRRYSRLRHNRRPTSPRTSQPKIQTRTVQHSYVRLESVSRPLSTAATLASCCAFILRSIALP